MDNNIFNGHAPHPQYLEELVSCVCPLIRMAILNESVVVQPVPIDVPPRAKIAQIHEFYDNDATLFPVSLQFLIVEDRLVLHQFSILFEGPKNAALLFELPHIADDPIGSHNRLEAG